MFGGGDARPSTGGGAAGLERGGGTVLVPEDGGGAALLEFCPLDGPPAESGGGTEAACRQREGWAFLTRLQATLRCIFPYHGPSSLTSAGAPAVRGSWIDAGSIHGLRL